jgi:hypothetical protein
MANITKINDILCVDVAKLDDILKAGVAFWDDNSFCPEVTPTPTPGPTPTPSPTPTCDPGCCYVELCYSPDGCRDACPCNNIRPYYLSIPCKTDPCLLSIATGIFNDDVCSDPAPDGYYSDGTDCYSWFGGVITFDAPCR